MNYMDHHCKFGATAHGSLWWSYGGIRTRFTRALIDTLASNMTGLGNVTWMTWWVHYTEAGRSISNLINIRALINFLNSLLQYSIVLLISIRKMYLRFCFHCSKNAG
jgi:hypothetical protein